MSVGISLFAFTDTFRLAKSLFLISLTSPYEQIGANEKKLLILGDSTGYGTGVRDKKNSIAGRIGSDFPMISIKNNSVNGRRLDQLVQEISSLDQSYDVVLLQMGANDILSKRPVADALANLEQLYKAILPQSGHIILMPSGNVGGAIAYKGTADAATYEQLCRDYYAAFTTFATSHPQFTFVNLFEEPADDLFVQDPTTYFALDGLHPSDAGYDIWYKTLKPQLEPFLSLE